MADTIIHAHGLAWGITATDWLGAECADVYSAAEAAILALPSAQAHRLHADDMTQQAMGEDRTGCPLADVERAAFAAITDGWRIVPTSGHAISISAES
jgi:hypothetical protein